MSERDRKPFSIQCESEYQACTRTKEHESVCRMRRAHCDCTCVR